MRQRIRDLQRDLKEQERYGEGDKKKRLKLRGLDRRVAYQELGEAKRELAAALQANATQQALMRRRSSLALEAQRANAREDAAQQVRQDKEGLLRDRESLFNTVQSSISGGTLAGTADSSNPWVNPVTGASLKARAQQKVAQARSLVGKIDRLKKAGATSQIMQKVWGEGLEGGNMLADALLADPAALRSISQSYAQLDQLGAQAGRTIASSPSTATTQITRLELVNWEKGWVDVTTRTSQQQVNAALSYR